MEQRLPKALTYYLEVEAVTEDHAKQPSSSGTSTVRSFYQNCSPKKSAKKALPLYTPPKLHLHSSWKLAQESSLLYVCVRHAIAVYCDGRGLPGVRRLCFKA